MVKSPKRSLARRFLAAVASAPDEMQRRTDRTTGSSGSGSTGSRPRRRSRGRSCSDADRKSRRRASSLRWSDPEHERAARTVLPRRLADERNLGRPRSRAAVRAAGHAHDDVVVPQTRVLADLLDLVDEHRQVALRLGLRASAQPLIYRRTIARPHVGNATQALLDSRRACTCQSSHNDARRTEKLTSSSLYCSSSAWILGFCSGVTSAMTRCWLAVRRKTPV